MSALLEIAARPRRARSALRTQPAGSRMRVDARRDLRARWLADCAHEAWKYTSLRALEQRTLVAGDASAARARSMRHASAARHRRAAAGVRQRRVSRRSVGLRRGRRPVDCDDCDCGASALDPARDTRTPMRDVAEAFARLNTALAIDGALMRVADGARIARRCISFSSARRMTRDRVATRAHSSSSARRIAARRSSITSANRRRCATSAMSSRITRSARGARLDLVQLQDARRTRALIRRSRSSARRATRRSAHACARDRRAAAAP